MRAALVPAVLFLALAGCAGKTTVIVVNEPPTEAPDGVEVVYVVDDATTIREIDAVHDLTFDNGRRQYLMGFAKRYDLGPRAQTHLVRTAMSVLNFDLFRRDVLMAMAGNPTLFPEARVAILDQVRRLNFDNSRQAVLNRLADNPGRPAPHTDDLPLQDPSPAS